MIQHFDELTLVLKHVDKQRRASWKRQRSICDCGKRLSDSNKHFFRIFLAKKIWSEKRSYIIAVKLRSQMLPNIFVVLTVNPLGS